MTRPEHFAQQEVDHLGNPIPEPELGEYLGVLYLERDALLLLLEGCGAGEIRDAELDRGRLCITWQSGDRCTLDWETVKQQAGLHHLPPPRSAFASDANSVGVLIHSPTPQHGLSYREPHSLVYPIGTLTRKGMAFAGKLSDSKSR